jgi:hypothetical protein
MSFLFFPTFANRAGAPDFGLTFIGSHYSDSTATAYTFSDVSFGSDSSAFKHVIIGVSSGGSRPFPARWYPTTTVDGTTCTDLMRIGSPNNDGGTCIQIVQTTATSGDLVVTFKGSGARVDVGVWEMLSGSATVSDSFTSTAATATGTIDVPNPGCCVGIFTAWTSSTATWTGLTEAFDRVGNGSGSGGSDFFASGSTGLTVSVSPSGSPTQRSLCVASFGEA